ALHTVYLTYDVAPNLAGDTLQFLDGCLVLDLVGRGIRHLKWAVLGCLKSSPMARGHWSVCRTFEKWAASPQVFPAPFRIKDVRRRVTGVLLTGIYAAGLAARTNGGRRRVNELLAR